MSAELDDEEVPSYREATDMTRARSTSDSQTALGSGSRSSSSPSTSHSYSLRSLTLEFKSHATSASSLPVFFTNSVIAGKLTWAASKAELPKEISITVSQSIAILRFLSCGIKHR